jgi:hypothetical protein
MGTSAVPPGLIAIIGRVPGVKTPGYYRLSLRRVLRIGKCHPLISLAEMLLRHFQASSGSAEKSNELPANTLNYHVQSNPMPFRLYNPQILDATDSLAMRSALIRNTLLRDLLG